MQATTDKNKKEADIAGEDEKPKIKLNNDIRDIRSLRQLERVNLDFDSPRLKQAMDDLGVSIQECQKKGREEFEKRGVDPDVIDLRFKHYQARLIDTLNRVIEQRRQIKVEQARELLRNQTQQQQTPFGNKPQQSLQISTQQQSPGGSLGLPNVTNKKKMAQTPAVRRGDSSRNLGQSGNALFLTEVANSAQQQTPVAGKQARFGQQGQRLSQMGKDLNIDLNASPPPQNMENQRAHSVDFQSLLDTERKKAKGRIDRSKEISLMHFTLEKQRLIAEKKLTKKMEKAQKNINVHNKTVKEKIGKFMEKKNARIEKQQEQQKQEFRDQLYNIKEFEKKQSAIHEKLLDLNRSRYTDTSSRLSFHKEKRDRASLFKQQEDDNFMKGIDDSLLNYEQKLNSAQVNQLQIIEEKKLAVRTRNEDFIMKIQKYKGEQEELRKTEYQKFQDMERSKNKRLRQTYNSMHKMWVDFKQKRKDQFDMMSNRKADGQEKINDRKRELNERMLRSQKAVAEFKAKEAHKNMLNKELAKLKDDDMKKLYTRQKRLDFRKKKEIISKEEKNGDAVKDMKTKEQKLVDFRYENKVKYNIERDTFSKSMQNWASQGFNNVKLPKDTTEMAAKIENRISFRNISPGTFNKMASNNKTPKF